MQYTDAMKLCNEDMQLRYSIETSQDHLKKSGIVHVDTFKDMQQRYAIADYPVMQLRFKDMPINARHQSLNGIRGRRHEGAAREDIMRNPYRQAV